MCLYKRMTYEALGAIFVVFLYTPPYKKETKRRGKIVRIWMRTMSCKPVSSKRNCRRYRNSFDFQNFAPPTLKIVPPPMVSCFLITEDQEKFSKENLMHIASEQPWAGNMKWANFKGKSHLITIFTL